MSARLLRSCGLAALVTLGVPPLASGQAWSVELSAGHIVYDPLADSVGANNLVGTLQYDARRDAWIYGSAAAPFRTGDPFWGAVGGGGRFLPANASQRRASLGLDVAADGYLFRDRVALEGGTGATLEAMPFARFAGGAAGVELRGGWRGHALSFGGVSERRGVFEAGARVTRDGTVGVSADLRWVRASEGTFPFLGGTLSYNGAPLQLWVEAGRWLHHRLSEETWGAGARVAVGGHTAVWTRLRQEAPDPLYWNSTRWTWSVGLTRQFGPAPRAILPTPRRESGAIVIRVPVADAPGTELSIAGDFNKWQLQPMRREGQEWIIRLSLAPGAYSYAFRSADGDWFVPESIPGRREDGFGGHSAVLVVS